MTSQRWIESEDEDWRNKANSWKRLRARALNFDLLFVAYVASLASAYFFGSSISGQYLYLLVVLPLAVLPFLPWRSAGTLFFRWGTLSRGLAAIRGSTLFIAAAVYLAAITVPDLFRGACCSAAAWTNWGQGLEILSFLAVTAFLLLNYPDFLSRLCIALSSLIALSALINIIGAIGQYGRGIFSERFTPTFGFSDATVATTAGVACGIALVAAVATATSIRNARFQQSVLFGSSGVLLLALLLTRTSGAYLATVVGVAVVGAVKPSRGLFVAGGVVGAAVVLFALADPQTTMAQFLKGDSLRFEIWRSYFPMAIGHLFIGYGQLANIHVVISGYEVFHPHNLVLSAQILGGLFAAAAMLAMLFGGIYWALRYLRMSGSVTALSLISGVATAGMTDFLLGTSGPNVYWTTFWLPIGICLGAEIATRATDTPSENLRLSVLRTSPKSSD